MVVDRIVRETSLSAGDVSNALISLGAIVRDAFEFEERNNIWNTPYLFNAKELDEETGMYYYGARYYDPRVSLWICTDPLEDDYPMFTSYCFVNNNPLIFIDPKGMDSYYTMDGVYLGDDKKKTQYVFAVRNEDYRFDKKSGYNLIYRKTQLRNNKNEAITKDEFNNLAGTLFAESTPGKNNSWKEAAAIYSVLENRGNADNKTTLEIASSVWQYYIHASKYIMVKGKS